MSVSKDGNGFTVITIDGGTGDKAIYVSQSTGLDTNDGLTTGTPVKTLGKALSLATAASGDQVLLKCGDTWTDEWFTAGNSTIEGAFAFQGRSAVGTVDTVANAFNINSTGQPFVIGYYGNIALGRPKVQTQPSTAVLYTLSGTYGSNLAILGIEFYAYKNDPGNAAYANAGTGAGVSFTGQYTSLLIEDCKFSFFSQNIDCATASGGVNNNLCLRRNIVVDAWAPLWYSVKAVGTYIENLNAGFLEENYWEANGWNQALYGPNSVSYSSSGASQPLIVTWSGKYNKISTAHSGDDQVIFTGSVPSELTSGQIYYAVNIGTDGANKFRVATSSGGAAITTTAARSGTCNGYWENAGPGIGQSRNVYQQASYLHPIFQNNYSISSSNEGWEQRTGGWCFNNFSAYNMMGISFGCNQSGTGGNGITALTNLDCGWNVVTHGSVNNQDLNRNFGSFGINFTNCQGTGVQAHDNLVCYTNSTYSYGWTNTLDASCAGTVWERNVFYSWDILENDLSFQAWNSGTPYNETAFVTYGGLRYQGAAYPTVTASISNTGHQPDISPTWWKTPPDYGVNTFNDSTWTGADPAKSIGGYWVSIGRTGNDAAFFADQRARLPATWTTSWEAASMNSYYRSGFGMTDPGTAHRGGRKLGKF